MKIFKFIALLFIATTIISCHKDNNDVPAIQQKITLLTQEKYLYLHASDEYQYDNQNRVVTVIHIDSTHPIYNTTETISYNTANQISSTIFNYDNQDKQIRITSTYNSNGQLVKFERYDIASGVETHSYDFLFSYSPGKFMYSIKKYPAETTYLATEYFINDNNNISREKGYNPDGSLSYVEDYLSYDNKKQPHSALPSTQFNIPISANNPLTFKITNYPSGNVSNRSYSYEYNQDGYVTKRTGTSGTTIYTYVKK